MLMLTLYSMIALTQSKKDAVNEGKLAEVTKMAPARGE